MERHLTEREQYVIEMCSDVFEMIHKKYKMDYSDITKLSKEVELCNYIDDGFEVLNSMGDEGLMMEIERYIKSVGGKLK